MDEESPRWVQQPQRSKQSVEEVAVVLICSDNGSTRCQQCHCHVPKWSWQTTAGPTLQQEFKKLHLWNSCRTSKRKRCLFGYDCLIQWKNRKGYNNTFQLEIEAQQTLTRNEEEMLSPRGLTTAIVCWGIQRPMSLCPPAQWRPRSPSLCPHPGSSLVSFLHEL